MSDSSVKTSFSSRLWKRWKRGSKLSSKLSTPETSPYGNCLRCCNAKVGSVCQAAFVERDATRRSLKGGSKERRNLYYCCIILWVVSARSQLNVSCWRDMTEGEPMASYVGVA